MDNFVGVALTFVFGRVILQNALGAQVILCLERAFDNQSRMICFLIILVRFRIMRTTHLLIYIIG